MRIELNEPSQPKGMEFHINGLGTLENGKAVEFSDDQIALFESLQGRSLAKAFEDNSNIKLLGGKEKGGEE